MAPWYRESPAAADLRDHLACSWQADVGGETQALIPDGCIDLLWIDDGSIWVCGPETSTWSFTLPPGTTAIGVRFRPGVAPPVLDLDAREVLNRRVRGEDLFGDRTARILSERLGDLATPARRERELERFAGTLIDTARPVDTVAKVVASRVAAYPPAPNRDLADELGLSERQLHRRCAAAFGYGPSTLTRILRLQRFLALVRENGSAAGLAQLALGAGYADQAHLSREARAIAGTTPSSLRLTAA